MCKLNRLLAGIFFLPLLALPLNSHADSNVRIHGGISVDTGNLRLFISDRHFGNHYYSDRYNRYYDHSGYRPSYNRSDRYGYGPKASSGGHKTKSHDRRYSRYDQQGHRHHSERKTHHRKIIIRDRHRHDYRKFRHERSYHNW